MQPPEVGDWLALATEPLAVDRALSWAVIPGCGAVVVFCGTVRDHADGRGEVVALDYEAYESQVLPRLKAIADEARRRWPTIGRVALLHRVGRLELGETSVVVVVSTPHRSEAFDSARFAIDAVKATVPIWKRETWAEGVDWGTRATAATDAASVASGPAALTVGRAETEERSSAWKT